MRSTATWKRTRDYGSLVSKLAYAPMTCDPGQCYAYQNVAFSLIGNVLTATTGKDYGQGTVADGVQAAGHERREHRPRRHRIEPALGAPARAAAAAGSR